MNSSPRGSRLHIAVFGRRNAGKSSLLNALTGQQVSIVSPVAGTTTDPVEKAMELLPIGPVLLIDTAGLDDEGELGRQRVEKSLRVKDRTDIAIIVAPADAWGTAEDALAAEFAAAKVPVVAVLNQCDRVRPTVRPALKHVIEASAITGAGLDLLRAALVASVPDGWLDPPAIVSDLLPPGGLCVLVVPIDKEAPKGRLILPQVQTIRDLLDGDQTAIVVKERELATTLRRLGQKPDLVVTDSQAFLKVCADVPDGVPVTSFSILFARYKGDLDAFVAGAAAIDRLQPGDRVLIAESCTHHAISDDIGRVKIPRWLVQYLGFEVRISTFSGHDFPSDLADYRLAIHCGSCTTNRREVLARILRCRAAGVPITNYGVAIAKVQGLLERVLRPFPSALEQCRMSEWPLIPAFQHSSIHHSTTLGLPPRVHNPVRYHPRPDKGPQHMSDHMISVDGNEACAMVAHKLSEVAAIYPITPSSNMGEWADEWSVRGRKNLWGQVPDIMEMQSEAGAIGAVHGALQAGSLATTFTASQGLLLMIPNMYKIAGELTAFTMHVSARCVATHALSIFGDHSDVMGCRMTGFAMLSSQNVQEAHDFAAIAHAATLKARVPFLHFFDGFRTSHEVNKIHPLSDEQLKQLVTDEMVATHRARALSPDKPVVRGTAQNPDTFFQAREACNRYHDAVPGIVAEVMEQFAKVVGRRYAIAEYAGAADADKVILLMGSGAETAAETAKFLAAKGEKVGVLTLRLYRPFPAAQILAALPKSVKKLAVLDRTKEPGANGDPLFQDVAVAVAEAGLAIQVVAGRYGLSSKEFTPAMVQSVFVELGKASPKRRFTVGIVDDITKLSLPLLPDLDVEPKDTVKALFYGLGADGTVGANKNSIKIIGHMPGMHSQGYFVYDSKKSGSMTVSHLRFGRTPVKAPYLISKASFVAVHQWRFIERMDVLDNAADGAVVLINAPFAKDQVWGKLPVEFQQVVLAKKLKLYAIDAIAVAKQTGMGGRINTIMQTCFFALSKVLPKDEAIAEIKAAIKKTYGKRGDEVVQKNWAAVDATLANLHEISGAAADSKIRQLPVVPHDAPEFTKQVQGVMLAGKGDALPVSAFPIDGTWPTATTQWEKRGIAVEIPVWDNSICIQCNKCAFVCPHAAIRVKAYDPAELAKAPATFKAQDAKAPELKGQKFTIQVAPEDCTGCGLCAVVCPAKDKANPKHKALDMAPALNLMAPEAVNYKFFLDLKEMDRTKYPKFDVRTSQFLQPLFEYSGACAGCGETPYVKLVSQLFGDRAIIANATGCSSIYGGNLPTTPYAQNKDGRGPAWANSLFEDNAEFGLGIRLGVDALSEQARLLLLGLAPKVGGELAAQILAATQNSEADFAAQRARVATLRAKLATIEGEEAKRLLVLIDYLVEKSVWIFGGDGWAYDIGYGGLDHVLANRRKVRILVMDTEVYSNTGGQASKATPIGASAKFAVAGKAIHKKDLGLMAMAYGHAYVASVAFGAKDAHTVQAFQEADSYPGPAIIIAYSHCIAHGYDLRNGLEQQKLAVNSGVWPLYRFDPRRTEKGELPLVLDSEGGKAPVLDYLRNETRFRMVEKLDPVRFKALSEMQVEHSAQRVQLYQKLAEIRFPLDKQAPAAKPQANAGAEE